MHVMTLFFVFGFYTCLLFFSIRLNCLSSLPLGFAVGKAGDRLAALRKVRPQVAFYVTVFKM